MALPGLEPRSGANSEGTRTITGSQAAATPAPYVEGSAARGVHEGTETDMSRRTVENALADLLELTRRLGADEDHPAVVRAMDIVRNCRRSTPGFDLTEA